MGDSTASPPDFVPFSNDVAHLVHGLPLAGAAWAGLFVVLDAVTETKALDERRWMAQARIESGMTTVGLHSAGFEDIQRAIIDEFRQYEQLMPEGALGRCFDLDSSRAERERVATLRSMEYRDYLLTPEWDETRRRAIDRALGRCQLCNGSDRLHVHHRTYERRGNEWGSDLIVLCADCHGRFHDKLPRPESTSPWLPDE